MMGCSKTTCFELQDQEGSCEGHDPETLPERMDTPPPERHNRRAYGLREDLSGLRSGKQRHTAGHTHHLHKAAAVGAGVEDYAGGRKLCETSVPAPEDTAPCYRRLGDKLFYR